jgi:hypothetical protein
VVEAVERNGVTIASARWSAATVAILVDHLAGDGARALAAVDDEELLDAWGATVEAFLDRRSPERRAIEGALLSLTGLSVPGLAAGLEAVLGGVRAPHAEALIAGVRRTRTEADGAPDKDSGTSYALVVLAGNVPALAVQPLLPALALRRPVLLKSATAEPLFAPAFVGALARRLPAIADGVVAITWVGGDAALEAPVLAHADPVLVYGGRAAVADLERRATGRVVDYGPKLSFAVIGADADLASAAAGVARDVALFDQRGCLSVQAAFVEGSAARATELGEALAAALVALAIELPPGAVDAMLASAVQQVRGAAEMRGVLASRLPIGAGTVVIEPAGAPLVPSPGLRTVRVYPLADLAALPGMLASWRGLLQGAALAGEGALALAPALAQLGVSRCTAPGELQAADASWHNGGRDPLTALRPSSTSTTL